VCRDGEVVIRSTVEGEAGAATWETLEEGVTWDRKLDRKVLVIAGAGHSYM